MRALTTQAPGAEPESLDLNDPNLTRFDIMREGARRDDIEIVHYEPPFPVPGTKAERRLARTVAGMFLLTGVSATAFLAIYIWWPWEYRAGAGAGQFYTPLLGVTLGIALLSVGFGILIWGKKLLPREVAIQDRHEGGSSEADRKITGNTLAYMADELGVKRRPLLGVSLLAGLAPVGAVAVAPLVGGMITNPHKNNELMTTGWAPVAAGGATKLIRLTREDGTPIRPEDVSAGRPADRLPGHPRWRQQQARRLPHPPDPPAGERRADGPRGERPGGQARLHVGQLHRLLEDLYARRLPGQPL